MKRIISVFIGIMMVFTSFAALAQELPACQISECQIDHQSPAPATQPMVAPQVNVPEKKIQERWAELPTWKKMLVITFGAIVVLSLTQPRVGHPDPGTLNLPPGN
jgi:hypothetical protein